MKYRYNQCLDRTDRLSVFKAFLPRGLFLLKNRLRYKKHFPHATITADCSVATDAAIGKHCIIRASTVGSTVSIARFTTISAGSALTGAGRIDIGSFCSIGPETFFRSENHNPLAASTYPFEQVLEGDARQYDEYPARSIQLGHDVWVGARACVLAGANIGHGSIIAAGAVVAAGDFPPYAILGGSPARVIKMRFTDETIADILADPWWGKGEEEIFSTLLPFLHSQPESH